MALTHSLTINDLTVTVRELTVREVRDWAARVSAGLVEVDPVAHLVLDACSLQDIELMSDKTVADLDGLAPSELAEIEVVCRKLNPHFFRLRAAMAGAAQSVLHQARQQASKEPAPS